MLLNIYPSCILSAVSAFIPGIGRNIIAFAVDEQGCLTSPDTGEMNTVKIQLQKYFRELVFCEMNIK